MTEESHRLDWFGAAWLKMAEMWAAKSQIMTNHLFCAGAHHLLLRWGHHVALWPFPRVSTAGIWSVGCFQSQVAVAMAAELAWTLFWCEVSLEAEVGRYLCDVTWEGAFDGTINQTLQTGRGKVTLPLADVNKQLLTWWKWRACLCGMKERRRWWQMEDSVIINVILIKLLPVFLRNTSNILENNGGKEKGLKIVTWSSRWSQ